MTPYFDYHALAPELVLTGAILVVLVADLFLDERSRWRASNLAGLGVLAALVPVLTLAADGANRSMFDGAYVVDNYALVMKAFFLVVAYVTILLANDYIDRGDYYRGEFYFLILSSLLGMSVMASARDLLTIFVALEMLSIPTYLLAGWRKHDVRSNEASFKYYLIGVLATAVMLYGMSIVFGVAGSLNLSDIAIFVSGRSEPPLLLVGVFLTLVGFAFKVSAVPFHFWAPDTYEGAPTPVTAFLSVASKAGGFVAMLNLIFAGFLGIPDAWQPVLWSLAAASMTVGNLIALRQTNIVRMLAYSSIAQGGFILVPFAVAGDSIKASDTAFEAVIVYLLIYAAMNLGAFAVVIAVAQRTRSAEIESYTGLFQYAPGLTMFMTIFLFSLAGIPFFGGWFAKFVVFRSVLDAGTTVSVVLGVVAAVNSVIALYYYAGVARLMWFRDADVEDRSRIKVPAPLGLAIGLTGIAVVATGVYPQLVARLGELARLSS